MSQAIYLERVFDHYHLKMDEKHEPIRLNSFPEVISALTNTANLASLCQSEPVLVGLPKTEENAINDLRGLINHLKANSGDY